MKATILPALAAMLLVAPMRAAAQPGPETLDAWRRYVATTEARLQPTRGTPSGANGCDAAQPAGETIDVPAGAIHHWRGAVFIPGATLDRVLDRLLHPERGQPQEDVLESRVLSRTGDSLRMYLKLARRAIVTVIYDTEHDMAFRRWTPSLATARSVATSIRETGGGDRGFLWRLNSYWRYEAVILGVAVELESLTLSRGIPSVFRPIVASIVRSIARESMCRTLDNVRKAMTAG